MGRIEKSIEIKAAPEKVWEMLALDRHLEWSDYGWKKVEYTSEVHTPEDKLRVGATAHITEKHEEFDFEITESLKNEKITGRQFNFSRSGNATMTVTYVLEPVEEGIRLTSALDYEMPWGILGKILGRLLRGQGEKSFERSLENLKSILEK